MASSRSVRLVVGLGLLFANANGARFDLNLSKALEGNSPWPMQQGFQYTGYCRYGNDKRDRISESWTESKLGCQVSCENDAECTAYSWTPTARHFPCDKFRGGPYTYGVVPSGHSDATQCYEAPCPRDCLDSRILAKGPIPVGTPGSHQGMCPPDKCVQHGTCQDWKSGPCQQDLDVYPHVWSCSRCHWRPQLEMCPSGYASAVGIPDKVLSYKNRNVAFQECTNNPACCAVSEVEAEEKGNDANAETGTKFRLGDCGKWLGGHKGWSSCRKARPWLEMCPSGYVSAVGIPDKVLSYKNRDVAFQECTNNPACCAVSEVEAEEQGNDANAETGTKFRLGDCGKWLGGHEGWRSCRKA